METIVCSLNLLYSYILEEEGLFLVMFFSITNNPVISQTMMNIYFLRSYINVFGQYLHEHWRSTSKQLVDL